jgi:hypothetical protein
MINCCSWFLRINTQGLPNKDAGGRLLSGSTPLSPASKEGVDGDEAIISRECMGPLMVDRGSILTNGIELLACWGFTFNWRWRIYILTVASGHRLIGDD